MIVCVYRVTDCHGRRWTNDGWFRDEEHFDRVLAQWNAGSAGWRYAKVRVAR